MDKEQWTRRHLVGETGPGWAVTDYDGRILPGRWATEDDAHEHGLAGMYLLSGAEAVNVKPHVAAPTETGRT